LYWRSLNLKQLGQWARRPRGLENEGEAPSPSINMIIEKLKPFEDLIAEACDAQNTDIPMVMAIIWQESRGDSFAMRFEPHLKPEFTNMPKTWALKHAISMDTEINAQHVSYGLMQILGVTAREIGFDDKWPKLFIPKTNLFWGCKFLNKLQQRFNTSDDIIAAYNAGTPKKIDGKYTNQRYVDAVNTHIKMIEYEKQKSGKS